MTIPSRMMVLAALLVISAMCLAAQQALPIVASATTLPNSPGFVLQQEQSSSRTSDSQSQQPGPDPKLPESSVPQQNSAQTPIAKEQPKRILYIIPNYRAVSAGAV